jgi:hypothetical protein
LEIRHQITAWDILGIIADVQTSFTENFKRLESKYNWLLAEDARLQIVFNCSDLAANARLSIAILYFSKSNGMVSQDWWQKWAAYSDKSFSRISDFKLYVDDKSRQYIHRIQEQLLITSQIYIESFLRSLGRQFGIDENQFWKLKERLLEKKLKFNKEELLALAASQYLKNSLHNKGLHYDPLNNEKEFVIDGYSFSFRHNMPIQISWDHIKALLIANSELLYKIIDSSQVSSMPSFSDKNIVILTD